MLSAVTPLISATNTPHPWRLAATAVLASSESAAPPDDIARHFLQRAPSIRSAADLVDDPMARSFLQQALGLHVDEKTNAHAQAELISAMLNFHEFQIPSRLQRFIELYHAKATAAPTALAPAAEVHGPILPPQAAPLSDALLAHLQSLKIGGS
jgi:hypothetical protein